MLTRRAVVVLGFACALAAPGPAAAAPGGITQLAPPFGCLASGGLAGACTTLETTGDPAEVAVSPDGRFVYVTGFSPSDLAVTTLARDPATGRLTFAGCVSATGLPQCGAIDDISNPEGIALSPDGTSAYVAHLGGLAVLDRDASGVLVPKAGAAGCFRPTPTPGCTQAQGLGESRGVAVSPDGANVYVATHGSDAIAVFRRAQNGTLTQPPGALGCVSETGAPNCTDGRALNGVYDVAVSPDGGRVYAVTLDGRSVVAFNRGAQGSLNLLPGAAGCLQQTGGDGCGTVAGLSGQAGIAIAPAGGRLYVSTAGSGAGADTIRVIDLVPGGLADRSGPSGCVSNGGLGGCSAGRALDDPWELAISPDGAQLYAASSADPGSITVFDIGADGGLTARAGAEGCATSASIQDCATGPALTQQHGVAVSPDGANVYTTGWVTDSVTVFARELPATNGPPPPPPPPDEPELVAGRIVATFRPTPLGTIVRKLEARRVERGARVTLRCSNRRRGCPRRRRSALRRRSPKIAFTRLFAGSRLRPGAELELRITAAGKTGKVVRFVIRRGRQPRRTGLCLPPGARRPARC